MSQDLLDRIDQRTRLAGHNRLALLLFRLGSRQLFGVNVFKVKEVLQRPPLFTLPQLPKAFAGAADVRGRSVPVLDLARAIRHDGEDLGEPNYLVVTEFNRTVQGFLVAGVDRIVNIAVEHIQPPPDLGGDCNYLTGVARNQIRAVLEQLGLEAVLLSDGRQALDHLQALARNGEPPGERYAMVISDIEMPAMDGYTLTTEIRRDPALRGLFVLLHTSLSGVFNQAMVERVGADDFVPKYSERELAQRVTARVSALG